MKHVDLRDLIGGLLLILIGVCAATFASSQYEVGTAARMGPGYFPVVLGRALAALGLVIALLAFRRTVQRVAAPQFSWRPLVAILFAVAAFALTVHPFGLVPATVLTTFISSFAERGFKLRRTLQLGAALGLLAWLIFNVGLQMNLPAFTFLG